MKIATFTPGVSILAQPTVAEVGELAARCFRSIITNRPEGESADQPAWEDLAAAASAHGMEAAQIPVVMGQIDRGDVAAFREALERMPTPIAAFCRTGTRAALLWALANQGNLTTDERIRIAEAEGYDLAPFRNLLNEENDHAGA